MKRFNKSSIKEFALGCWETLLFAGVLGVLFWFLYGMDILING